MRLYIMGCMVHPNTSICNTFLRPIIGLAIVPCIAVVQSTLASSGSYSGNYGLSLGNEFACLHLQTQQIL
jgi:hypothetical protein